MSGKGFVCETPTPAYLGNPHDHAIWETVANELASAVSKFPSFNSPHEGYAVIAEELDELWDEVKANRGRTEAAQQEAIQVAAMALRYVLDLAELRP
jgi:hypothetical protein